MYKHNYYRKKRTKFNKNGIYKKIVLSILVPVIIFFVIYSIDLIVYRGRIYPNIVGLHQDIGSLNIKKANESLIPVTEKILSNPIDIKYRSFEISIIPKKQLGASIDIKRLLDEAYSIARRGPFFQRIKDRISLIRKDYIVSDYLNLDDELSDNLFAKIQSEIEQKREDAVLESNRVLPAKVGIEVNKQVFFSEIMQKITELSKEDSPTEIEIPVYYNKPEILTNELLSEIGVNELISKYETSLEKKEENTLYNIQKASDEINGIILKPGDVFAFNQLIGPAEKEDGYKESTIISNGRFVSGYGGGVCQVSTTLYNAVLLANLQIVERYNHSIYGDVTNYVPLGRDAAIYFGYKDLRFKNSLDQAIILFCEIKNNQLVATIYGEKSLNKNISIITKEMEVHDFDIIEIKRENMEYIENKILQEGVTGYNIKTYRTILDSNGEHIEFISNDQYISVPEKIIVD